MNDVIAALERLVEAWDDDMHYEFSEGDTELFRALIAQMQAGQWVRREDVVAEGQAAEIERLRGVLHRIAFGEMPTVRPDGSPLYYDGGKGFVEWVTQFAADAIAAGAHGAGVSELKPCPDCGGEAVVSRYHGLAVNGFVVECATDMEIGDGFHSSGRHDTEAEAIAAWNRPTHPKQ